MKILFVTPYPYNKAPSQRFRFEQYLSWFEEKGYKCNIEPFLDEKTWNIFYTPGNTFSKFLGVANGFFNRLKLLFIAKQYDILFIHREACFIGPAFFENYYSKITNKRVILDFDDAIWLHDVSDANESLGFLKSPSKTAHIIKHSACIIAGNEYLASYARRFNSNVFIIPTTIDTEYHKPAASIKSRKNITIGWTGSSTTIKHFELVVPILKVLKNKYRGEISFTLISNKPFDSPEIDIDFIPWSKADEITDLSRIDIGIMPLPDDMWAKGKCGFKGLQYMAMEIPTVMSPVGVNTEIIRDGENGFLAASHEEWIEKLSLLIESADLRQKFGKAGRKTVIERYSVNSQKENYLKVFNTVIHS